MSISILNHDSKDEILSEKPMDTSSNNLLNRADILLHYRDRLEAVEIDIDLAREEICTLKEKNQELLNKNFLKENELKELHQKNSEMNSKNFFSFLKNLFFKGKMKIIIKK